jgi:hypothetical protein
VEGFVLRRFFSRSAAIVVFSLPASCSESSVSNDAGGSGGQDAGQSGSGSGGAPAGGSGGDSGGSGGDSGEAGSAGSPECPAASEPVSLGMLAVPGLSEASGIAASRVSAGVLFTHNDSGHPAEVYAVAEDGAHVATLAFTGALAHDWEDIAIGPGPVDGAQYLYVADIGDDPVEPWRETVIVERALEPELASTDRGRALTLDFDSIYLSYPDGPHNAETLFVDPSTSDLYIVTKALESAAVYVARAPLPLERVSPLELVTGISFLVDGVQTGLATGGDLSPDGRLVAVRTETAAFLWRRSEGTDFSTTFAEAPCDVPVPRGIQGEAIGFALDSASTFSVGEGDAPELFRVELER